eukprot:scaffold6021_cov117-Isochrysis_galbana.AAC.6
MDFEPRFRCCSLPMPAPGRASTLFNMELPELPDCVRPHMDARSPVEANLHGKARQGVSVRGLEIDMGGRGGGIFHDGSKNRHGLRVGEGARIDMAKEPVGA